MFSPPQDRPPQFGGVSPQFLKLQNQSNLQFPRQALLVSVSVFLFGFVSDTAYCLELNPPKYPLRHNILSPFVTL